MDMKLYPLYTFLIKDLSLLSYISVVKRLAVSIRPRNIFICCTVLNLVTATGSFCERSRFLRRVCNATRTV